MAVNLQLYLENVRRFLPRETFLSLGNKRQSYQDEMKKRLKGVCLWQAMQQRRCLSYSVAYRLFILFTKIGIMIVLPEGNETLEPDAFPRVTVK